MTEPHITTQTSIHGIQTRIYKNSTPTNKISKTAYRYEHTNAKDTLYAIQRKSDYRRIYVEKKTICFIYFNDHKTCIRYLRGISKIELSHFILELLDLEN